MVENLLQNLLVGLIVLAAAWYAGARYLPRSWRRKLGQKQAAAAGCGSGCDSCGSCDSPAPAATKRRVIVLHKA